MSYLLRLFTGNPVTMVYAAAALFAAGLALGGSTGWTLNGWRLSGEIQRLTGVAETQKQSLATFEGANKRCAAGLADVKGAVKGFVDDGARRSAAALKAMQEAAARAQGHLEDAKAALNRPMPAAGAECDTAAAEAAAYARKRKGSP